MTGGNYPAGFIFGVFSNAVKKSVRNRVRTVFLAIEKTEAYNVEQYILIRFEMGRYCDAKEKYHWKICIVFDRTFYCVYGSCLFDEGRTWNIPGSIGSVLCFSGMSDFIIRRLVKSIKYIADYSAGTSAQKEV